MKEILDVLNKGNVAVYSIRWKYAYKRFFRLASCDNVISYPFNNNEKYLNTITYKKLEIPIEAREDICNHFQLNPNADFRNTWEQYFLPQISKQHPMISIYEIMKYIKPSLGFKLKVIRRKPVSTGEQLHIEVMPVLYDLGKFVLRDKSILFKPEYVEYGRNYVSVEWPGRLKILKKTLPINLSTGQLPEPFYMALTYSDSSKGGFLGKWSDDSKYETDADDLLFRESYSQWYD
ncbi:MAG: hypothetical protein ISR95_01050 [Candidatus Marinimicrobia bacterium]|nr:hypothetical protein [Candidatus Neomarinimicrobiota bacterium]